MKRLPKTIGLLAAAVLVIGGISAATVAYTTQAQSNQAQTSNNNNGIGWGRMGKGQMDPQVTGTVSAVNGNTITLTGTNGTTYTVDASKAEIMKIVNNAKTTIQVSGIAVGDTLHVSGTVSGNAVTASKIIDGVMPARQNQAAAGTITAIDGNTNTITLKGDNGTTYTVNAGNAEIMIAKKAGTSLQNSGIQTGDTLQVFGTVSGTNITATKILDGNLPGGPGHGFGMMDSNQEQ
jgi:hypothetical protein